MLWILLIYQCLLFYQCKADLLTHILNFPKSHASRLLVSYTRNDTEPTEHSVGWEGVAATGSFFTAHPEITKAVYYSLNDRQKYVISDFSQPVCIASDLDRATPLVSVFQSQSGSFNLIQVITANLTYAIGHCKLIGPGQSNSCIFSYKCLFDPADLGFAIISVSKCRSFYIRLIDLHARGSKPVRFIIRHFYKGWTDNDWRATSPDGASMSFIEQHFVTPSMVYCSNRESARKMPQLPDYFSMRVEEVHSHEPELRKTAFKVFDFKNRLVREDLVPDVVHHPELFSKFGARRLSIVEDFGTGSRFVMDEVSGNCSILPLGVGLFTKASSIGHLRMRYSYELLGFNDPRCWQYTGRVHIRGQPAQRFLCQRQLGADASHPRAERETVEAYWRQENGVQALAALRQKLVPLNRPLNETLDYTWHVFDFRRDRGVGSEDTFDISRCYRGRPDERVDFLAIVQASYKQLTSEAAIFVAIRNGLARAANVPPHRIARIRLSKPPPQTTDLALLWFSLLGHPSAPQQNSHYALRDQVSLERARVLLQRMTEHGLVTIKGRSGRVYHLLPNHLVTVQAREAEAEAKGRYHGGDMAALGLSMLGAGCIIGFLAVFCFNRRRRHQAVALYVHPSPPLIARKSSQSSLPSPSLLSLGTN